MSKQASSTRLMRRLTSLFLSEFLEEHAEDSSSQKNWIRGRLSVAVNGSLPVTLHSITSQGLLDH